MSDVGVLLALLAGWACFRWARGGAPKAVTRPRSSGGSHTTGALVVLTLLLVMIGSVAASAWQTWPVAFG